MCSECLMYVKTPNMFSESLLSLNNLWKPKASPHWRFSWSCVVSYYWTYYQLFVKKSESVCVGKFLKDYDYNIICLKSSNNHNTFKFYQI